MSAVWPTAAPPNTAFTTPKDQIGTLAKMAVNSPDVKIEKPTKKKDGSGAKRDYQPAKYSMGYLHITLAWMAEWNWQTRARVLMERTYLLPLELFKKIVWLHPPDVLHPSVKDGDQNFGYTSIGSHTKRIAFENVDPVPGSGAFEHAMREAHEQQVVNNWLGICFDFIMGHQDWRGL